MSKDQDRLDNYAQKAKQDDVEKIGNSIDGMKRGGVAKIWDDVMSLWAMIKDPNAAWASKAIAIGALVYLITPLDAIPDFIPIFGLTDDVGVILAAIAALRADMSKYKK